MKPVLFESDSTNFDNNGIGVLYDAASCSVTEEYNGAFDMELEYPTDGEWVDYIVEGRIILAKPNDVDDPHAFRIYEVQKDLDQGTVFVRATSITDDLAGNLITYASVNDGTVQQAFTAIKNNLIEQTIFDFVSDIQTRSTSAWTRINPLQAIVGTSGSLVDLWGGDVKRTNNTVYLYSRRGKDHVTVIRPGKNIDGFNMVTSLKGLITKILPFYTYTPEKMPEYEMVPDNNGNLVKQTKYSSGTNVQPDPVTVTGEVVVSDKAANYPTTYYSSVDYSNNTNINDQVKAYVDAYKQNVESSASIVDTSGFDTQLQNYIYGLLNDEAKGYFVYNNPGCDEPSVSIKVNMIEIADSPEWELYKNLESIQITDTVDVYVKKFNVDVEVTIQTIVYDSIGERVISVTAGSAKNNLVQSISKTYEDKAVQLINQYISTSEHGIYNTINRTADGQSKRFSGYTEPSAGISTEGDLWFKELGNGDVDVYMYSGGGWKPKVSGPEVIARLVAEGIDAKNITVSNLDAANITSGDMELSHGLRIVNNGVPVVEIDATTGQVKITSPNLATQDDLNNIALTPGPQGDPGPAGTSSYTHIAWANSADGVTGFSTTDSANKLYIGMYVDTTDVAANTPSSYKWTLIKGSDGTQGIQGPAGADGQTPYFHVAYATNSTGTTGFSTSDSTGKTYIGTYTDYTSADSTDPTKYKWVLIQGPQGQQGPQGTQGVQGPQGQQGIQGPAGANGVTYYTWIKYADTPTTGMSDLPDGKTYMGIAYNKTTATESTTYSDYSWSLIKGADGVQGPAGTNGTTTYTWVKYADDALGGNMSDSPTGKRYLGLAYNKTTATESTNASDYSWSPLYDNVSVGGRNVALGTRTFSSDYWTTTGTWTMDTDGDVSTASATNTGQTSNLWWGKYSNKIPIGEFLNNKAVVQFEYKVADVAAWDMQYPCILELYDNTGTRVGWRDTLYNFKGNVLPTNGVYQKFVVAIDISTDMTSWATGKSFTDVVSFGVRLTLSKNGTITFKKLKIESGTVQTPWNDDQDQVDNKASNADLNALGQIVTDLSTDIGNKADAGSLQSLTDDYNARMAQDVKDKQALSDSLSTMDGRMTLVETIAGNNKIVTDFINTVITESNEGIYIANNASSTGILIASDRISFMSNNVEVAYISNQTMQINHGIFVQSATIANFKFEAIPGTNILAIQWVGG